VLNRVRIADHLIDWALKLAPRKVILQNVSVIDGRILVGSDQGILVAQCRFEGGNTRSPFEHVNYQTGMGR
jgi:hypothetical protein